MTQTDIEALQQRNEDLVLRGINNLEELYQQTLWSLGQAFFSVDTKGDNNVRNDMACK